MDSLFEKTDLKEALVALSFSEKEIQVLIFLLNVGKAPASTIALRTKMKRSSCYLILSSLVQKNFLIKTAHDGTLAFSVNSKYPFKAEREAHDQASQKVEEAFATVNSPTESVDFDEILDVAVEMVARNLNEIVGIFLIENEDLVFRQAHLLGYESSISKFVKVKLFGLKTSVQDPQNNVAVTAKTGKSIFGERLSDFVCPMVDKRIADGIQAIPGFKFLYSFPLKTKKRIYGTGMISFNTEDQFIAKKVAFEKIMDRVAECIELRLAMQKLESRSLELTDLDILNSTLKKLPVEMMSEEPWNEITALKMQEVRRFKLLQ